MAESDWKTNQQSPTFDPAILSCKPLRTNASLQHSFYPSSSNGASASDHINSNVQQPSQRKIAQKPMTVSQLLQQNCRENTNNGNIHQQTSYTSETNNLNELLSGAQRETGVIEKMLHSYGFIQCCDREARLFFHFTEYKSPVTNMTIGEFVTFQASIDKKTEKPIAISVVPVDPSSSPSKRSASLIVADEPSSPRKPKTSVASNLNVLTSVRITGSVISEIKAPSPTLNSQGKQTTDGTVGRVCYEESGEMFFLPFTQADVDGGAHLKAGDSVTFLVAADKRSNTLQACNIRSSNDLSSPPSSNDDSSTTCVREEDVLRRGVVCSMKDTFGFIEREDAVREIFFHFSEYQGDLGEDTAQMQGGRGDISTLALGDDIQFNIQMRNGKEVAVNLRRLPRGTVIFEDVGLEKRRGRIVKPFRAAHGRVSSDPLGGQIRYETVQGSIEINYGDKDEKGDYTLLPNDIVEFNIATDRRDKLQRATNISLVEDTFKVNGEKREMGVIASVRDGYGFIRCSEQDLRMFFHFSEIIGSGREPRPQEDVEFTIIQDPTSPDRQIAIRIKHLPRGSVSFESVLPEKYKGNVVREPCTRNGNRATRDSADPGIIMYDVSGTKQTIPFNEKAVVGALPSSDDLVEFQICESRKNNTKTAVNVRLLTTSSPRHTSPPPPSPSTTHQSRPSSMVAAAQAISRHQGFVATLKENFGGFIELADHESEVFFHFNNFDGCHGDLELGDEVEFTLGTKTAKVNAENIRKLPRGSVSPEEVLQEIYTGRVLRGIRLFNPEQDEYAGLVQMLNDDGTPGECLTFGVTSLSVKKESLLKGSLAKFQIAVVKATGKQRATNMTVMRLTAKVESLKDKYGVLSHECEDGQKVSFQLSDVLPQDDGSPLRAGDLVEFVLAQNSKDATKYCAKFLRKIIDKQRPERLISRLKSMNDENPHKVVVIRQPRGPDSTKGFKQARTAPGGNQPNDFHRSI